MLELFPEKLSSFCLIEASCIAVNVVVLLAFDIVVFVTSVSARDCASLPEASWIALLSLLFESGSV